MVDFTQKAASAASGQIMEILCPALDGALSAHTAAEYAATRGSGEGEVAKKRIGSGYIGLECARQLGFRFHKFPTENRDGPVSKGELQRHAESGHWTEAKTVEWLRLCGFVIRTDTGKINAFGKPEQIGWKAARNPETGQFRLAGEVDGVIDGFTKSEYVESAVIEKLSALIKPPTIWESKKATDKKWKKFCKERVKGADSKYYGQLQANMAYMGVQQTLFSMLNLDNMKYYFELVPFDLDTAQTQSDRAVMVMGTDHPFQLPRIGRAEDDFKCKFCDFHGQCWKGLVIQPAPTPSASTAAPQKPVASAPPMFNPNWRT